MQLDHHIRIYYVSLGSGTTWTRQVLPTDDLKYGHQIITLWIGLAWGLCQFAWYTTASPAHVFNLLTVELLLALLMPWGDTAEQLKYMGNK